MEITFDPLKETKLNQACRLVVKDYNITKLIVLEELQVGSTYKLDISEFNPNWNYKFKYQIKKFDSKKNIYRWIDYTKYKFLYPEFTNKDNLSYLLYKNPSSDKLVIIFQAISTTQSYKYTGTLKNVNVNKLFIKDNYGNDTKTKSSYYLGNNNTFDISDKVQKLIKKITQDLNIAKEDTIFVGSSKGGYAAIYHGYKFGAGFVAPGGPQILLGNYLSKGHEEKSIGKSIFNSLFGEINNSNIKHANNLIRKVLEEAPKPYPTTRIHVGYWEPHFKEHVVPFMDIARELDISKISLDIIDYSKHSGLAEFYPKFLLDTVEKFISNTNK